MNPEKTNTPGWTRTSGLVLGVAIPSGLAPLLDPQLKYARLDSNQRPWD